ncbi:MAG: ABC transporter permease [Roseiflexaceae bacterium]
MRLQRYFRLAAVFTGASISAQLEYRANFILSLIASLLAAGGSLFGLMVLSANGSVIGGWSYREAAVVVGLFTLVQGVIGAVFQPNLSKIAEAVRLGTMDFTLLKPIDAQFFVSTRNISLFQLIDVLLGLGIVGWAASGLPGLTLAGVLVGGLLMLAGLLIVYAIWFMLSTTAFWFVKVENLTELFSGLFRAGQFPVSAYPGWARLLFTFVVPVAFITTVPAEALIGRFQPLSALGAAAVAAALLVAARWLWGRAIASYTSASS